LTISEIGKNALIYFATIRIEVFSEVGKALPQRFSTLHNRAA
jgi:hypothetical protein